MSEVPDDSATVAKKEGEEKEEAEGEESKDKEEELITEKKEDDTSKTKEENDKSLQDLKKTALVAEKAAAQDIISKFGVEYGQIKLSKIANYLEEAKDLFTFH